MAPIPGNNRDDPDANKDDDDVEQVLGTMPPVVITMDSSSDSDNNDDDDDGYQGYQMLPQEPIAGEDGQDMEADEGGEVQDTVGEGGAGLHPEGHLSDGMDFTGDTPSYMQVPQITAAEITERAGLWNAPRYEPGDMNQEQVDKIKNAMAGFSIPPNCVPEWAKFVPDDDWKSKMLARLQPDSESHTNAEDSSKNSTDTRSTCIQGDAKQKTCHSREDSSDHMDQQSTCSVEDIPEQTEGPT